MNPFRRFFVRLYLWYCVYILKVDEVNKKDTEVTFKEKR